MVILRIATPADASLLERLAHEIWHLHYPSIISFGQIEYMLACQYSVKAITESFEQGVKWLIAEVDSLPVGFVAYNLISDTACKLEKIYIHPEHQGRGIGRKAIGRVVEFAKRCGAQKVVLNVNRKNSNSIEAYLRFGFQILHEEDTYLGPFLLDDYVMSMSV